jgi:NhaC family Na+:H+ antiporter
MQEISEPTRKHMTLGVALFGFFMPLTLIIVMITYRIDIKVALAAAIAAESVFGIFIGRTWGEIERSAMNGISRISQTIIIMILIGMIIGVWISSGSIQTMLYYGLNMINPKFFVPITFLICIITSTMTGTSWGTAGTMGIALIGVAQGLGVPIPLVAGAIISGALVGDKLSPLSDTTLLASAVTEVNLFDHIVSLAHVTIPVSVIAVVLYTYFGLQYGAGTADLRTVQVISDTLKAHYAIGPLMLAPLLFVLVMSGMRKPSIPVFAGGVLLGMIWAVAFQDMELADVVKASINGFVSKTGNADVDKLLTRGGAMDMAGTIFLCIGAGMFAGVFEATGVLSRLMASLVRIVRNVGTLVTAVVATGTALMFGGAGQTCTISLPAVAFRKAFEDMDVHPAVLSRTLECTGTVLGAIVPWDASAILYTGLFGVTVAQYLPYVYLSLLSPIVAILTAYMGFGVFRYNEKVRLFAFKKKGRYS